MVLFLEFFFVNYFNFVQIIIMLIGSWLKLLQQKFIVPFLVYFLRQPFTKIIIFFILWSLKVILIGCLVLQNLFQSLDGHFLKGCKKMFSLKFLVLVLSLFFGICFFYCLIVLHGHF